VDMGIRSASPLKLIQALARNGLSLVVVGLVRPGTKHLAEEAMLLGAREVLQLPDDVDKLPHCVDRMVRGRKP
jgi:DNA-binding NtrC family response regulator